MKNRAALFVFLLLTIWVCRISHAQEKPNIIFIMADDLGYGDIEPYGQKEIKTPNLNSMAEEGILFTHHYAGTSVCAPSRAILMTGLHSGHCEVRGNKQHVPHGQLPLRSQATTIAEILKQSGYVTGMIGKWGLGEYDTSGDPLKQGFDFHYGYTDQVLAHNHFPEFMLRNGKKEYLKNKVQYLDSSSWHNGRGSVTVDKKEFADELFTKEAIDFISTNRDRDFFLYLPFIIPHDNGEAEENEQFEVPSQGVYANKQWSKIEKDYASSITLLDEYVGKITKHIKDLGLEKKTIIIFTSDNGPKNDDMRFDSNGGLRGMKRDLYEGGLRVPFIAWWPGKIQAGQKTNRPTPFWDFLATAADIAGIKLDLKTDGISYLPTLLGQKTQVSHSLLYFEIHERQKLQAALWKDWKMIKNLSTGKTELFNLAEDPLEQKEVSNKYPVIIQQVGKLMDEARIPNPDFPFPGE